MESRCEKFLLEAEEGIVFDVSEATNGTIVIRAMKNFGVANYEKPPIPKGYMHICGEWNNGFVIERITDGSQFVWVPVGSLEPNGTLDGKRFCEKFGRRNYRNDVFSDEGFHEHLNCELIEQIESVKKYGGFYISRYTISKSEQGKPQSVAGADLWGSIKCKVAKEIASTMEDSNEVKSHLTFGAEYDSILEWFINSRARTRNEIVNDSTNWGNYFNSDDSRGRAHKTGSSERWVTNNIYDLAGNLFEFTQEFNGWLHAARGGHARKDGNEFPAAYRSSEYPDWINDSVTFRVALCIK